MGFGVGFGYGCMRFSLGVTNKLREHSKGGGSPNLTMGRGGPEISRIFLLPGGVGQKSHFNTFRGVDPSKSVYVRNLFVVTFHNTSGSHVKIYPRIPPAEANVI